MRAGWEVLTEAATDGLSAPWTHEVTKPVAGAGCGEPEPHARREATGAGCAWRDEADGLTGRRDPGGGGGAGPGRSWQPTRAARGLSGPGSPGVRGAGAPRSPGFACRPRPERGKSRPKGAKPGRAGGVEGRKGGLSTFLTHQAAPLGHAARQRPHRACAVSAKAPPGGGQARGASGSSPVRRAI